MAGSTSKNGKKPATPKAPKPPKLEQALGNTAEHVPDAPETNGNGMSNPTSKDKQRPSAGDMFGKPNQNDGRNLAKPVLEVTRDGQDWLAQMILTPKLEIIAARMLAKQMTRNGGRLNPQMLVFHRGMLARSRDGRSLDMYERIAIAEEKKKQMQRGFDQFYGRFGGNGGGQAPPPQNMGAS